MRQFSVTKEFTFDAAHLLPDYDGPCDRMHGHTWKVATTFVGERQANGIVVDFHEITVVVEEVIDLLDHEILNSVIPNPTAENIAEFIFDRIEKNITSEEDSTPCKLIKVRVWESPTAYAEVEDVEGVEVPG